MTAEEWSGCCDGIRGTCNSVNAAECGVVWRTVKERQVHDIERLGQGMADVLTIGDSATIEAVFSSDYVEEYPQSGETIRGRSAIQEMLASFPSGNKPMVVGEPRITRTDHGFVGEYLLDYGPQGLYHAVGFYTVRDGKIVHGKEYFAAPFEPAPWRARWVASS